MSRYINYDDLDYRNDMMHGKSSEFLDGVIYMAQRIEDALSIDIVRCKECKYHNTHRCFMAFSMIATEDNGYCYMGERTDDE